MATSLRYPKGHAFFDNNGVLLAGGSLEYFRAGTSTAQGIFSDADGMVALPNPVALNSAGRAVDGSATPVAVYLSDEDGFDYKEEIANSTGTVLYTDDDIPSPVDPGASLSDFAKPTTAWSTDTDASVNLTTSAAGTGRLASTGSNSITYNLPSASAFVNGRPITFKKTNASNSVTLDADGADTIDGDATFSWTELNRAFKISSDGANWRLEADYLATFDNDAIAIQVFDASGTYTPNARMVQCVVISTAGGGGGGGIDSDGSSFAGGGGGGAGGTCIELFTAAQIGASQAVEIGAGGTAGANTGTSGGNGGNTNFGSGGALHFAVGGFGGQGSSPTGGDANDGGAGGTASGGLINLPGGGGGAGLGTETGQVAHSGIGGASFWGGGGVGMGGRLTFTDAGVAGGAYGSGGSGAANGNTTAGAAGGAGAPGFCVVIELLG